MVKKQAVSKRTFAISVNTNKMQQVKQVDDAPELDSSPPACNQDAVTYCQKEASLVALLRDAPNLMEPLKLLDAVRKVRVCMIAHVDVLSIDCVNTLAVDASEKASATAVSGLPSKKVVALDTNGLDDDSSMEINIYYSRHHNSAGHALRSGSALTANQFQSEGPASYFAEVLVHPLTWAFVLPFFAVGMYACLTRLATFVRRRREERRIESKQYMPVN